MAGRPERACGCRREQAGERALQPAPARPRGPGRSPCWAPCSPAPSTCRSSRGPSTAPPPPTTRVREVVDPAVRGLILDQAGRPLVANRTSVVVTVDRQRAGEGGRRRRRRHQAARRDPRHPRRRRSATASCPAAPRAPSRRPCAGTARRTSRCRWPTTSTPRRRCTIMERRRDFPGVSARLEAVREYPAPFNVNAAHMLGYLGPVTEEQLTEQGDSTAFDRLRRTDVVGRTGPGERVRRGAARQAGHHDAGRRHRRQRHRDARAAGPAGGQLRGHQHRRQAAGGRRGAAGGGRPPSAGAGLRREVGRGRRHRRAHRPACSPWRATPPTTPPSGSAA